MRGAKYSHNSKSKRLPPQTNCIQHLGQANTHVIENSSLAKMRKQFAPDEYRMITIITRIMTKIARIITTKTSGVDVMGTAGSHYLLKYSPSFEGKVNILHFA